MLGNPNPSHLPTFHPHSKTLTISIEACCSRNAPQPTPPNLSDRVDIPFASHTYYYSAPEYSISLLPSFTQTHDTLQLPPWFNPNYKIHFNSIHPCCYYYASQPTPPYLSHRIDSPFLSDAYFYSTPKYTLLNYHVLPGAVNLTNYQGSTPNIKLLPFPFMCSAPR
jgi:hypothetical protein